MPKPTSKKTKGWSDLTPKQIVSLWVDLFAYGFDWKKTKPDDLSNGEADFAEALAKQQWCQRVCDTALERFCMGSSIAAEIVKSASLARHNETLETGFWGRKLGLNGWEIMLGKFEDHVKQAASANAPPKEVETE